MAEQRSEQEVIRRNSLSSLRQLGIEPYPAEAYPVNHLSVDVIEAYTEKEQPFEVCLAGRIMSRRIMGKASFCELQDSAGRIQLYINRDEICPDDDKTLYNDVFKKLLDLGDYIGVKGEVFRTKVGEISILVKELKVLCKTLRPLPVVKKDEDGNVHDAFTDPELRHRMRYVDLTVNPDVKKTYLLRAKIIQSMRSFFNHKEWLEVETPILQSIHGGALARPFSTHHNALDIPLYLRIANELYLKRLIAGGFDGVYEIGKMFRNEGIDHTHNPEFTSMEIYVAYKDYHWMMDMVEDLLSAIAVDVLGTKDVMFQDKVLHFGKPYKRLSFFGAINEKVGEDVSKKTIAELTNLCKRFELEVSDVPSRPNLWDTLFSDLVEKELVQPTYVIDHPQEMTPLAKKHRTKKGLVERFELFINGKEIANAYSELNDPIDQRERFEKQLAEAKRGDEEAMAMDDDFVRCLEFGMPPTAGLGIGIDRLVMLFTGQSHIQEVIFFPQMKPERG